MAHGCRPKKGWKRKERENSYSFVSGFEEAVFNEVVLEKTLIGASGLVAQCELLLSQYLLPIEGESYTFTMGFDFGEFIKRPKKHVKVDLGSLDCFSFCAVFFFLFACLSARRTTGT